MSSNHTETSRLHTSYSNTQQVLIEMADLLGHKWHPVILQQLVATDSCGFSDLHAAIDDISNKMLSDSLTTLEQHGLVERVVVSEKPVRVRYSLTDCGQELEPALDAMVDWGRDHLTTAEPTAPSPPTATQATESADASPTVHWGRTDE